jgi:hypothetical protein
MTQDEYIARALEMEEGNVLEHRNYLAIEDEKRKRAKVVRQTVKGPLLRWISRIEDEAVRPVAFEEPNTPTSRNISNALASSSTRRLPDLDISTDQYAGQLGAPVGSSEPLILTSSSPGGHAPAFVLPPSASYPIWPPPVITGSYMSSGAPFDRPAESHVSPEAGHVHTSVASPMQVEALLSGSEVPSMGRVTKNYIIHELGQVEGTRKPRWKDTMRAVFGDHVRWETLKVFTGDSRPVCECIMPYNRVRGVV